MQEFKTKTVSLDVPNGFSPMIIMSQHEGIFTASVINDGEYSLDDYCHALLSLSALIAIKISHRKPEISQKDGIKMAFSRAEFLLEQGNVTEGEAESNKE
jgi:hypothetical protein